MVELLTVKWYCSNYYGPTRWFGDYAEPDDCDTEFITRVDKETWADGSASAICPQCKQILWQGYDEPELDLSNGVPDDH
jgi:hypothetical protein